MSGDGPLRLVLASANPDKAREIAAILSASLPVTLLARPADVADVVEDGETLLDNARLKARALVAATGTAAVADDTGLEVDALGGAPGVYSARYAGEDATYADNAAKLLRELARLADGGGARRARFRTVALVAFADGAEVWAEGTVEGTIAAEARGSGGFGYDPVFVPDGGAGTTFARDAAGGEGRGVAPGAGVPGARPPAGRTGGAVLDIPSAVHGALSRRPAATHPPPRGASVSAGPATPRRRAERRWRTRGPRRCRWPGSADRGRRRCPGGRPAASPRRTTGRQRCCGTRP